MQSKESYDKFYLSYKKRCGVKATINKREVEVFFKEIDDKVNESTDYKYMFVDYRQCKQGNIIKVNNSYYLATNKEENLNNNNLYEKFTVRKCQAIKFKGIAIFGLVDSKVFDVTQTKYFDLIDNQIQIQVSNEIILKLDDYIEYNKKVYRIIAINDTVENSLILKCQYDKLSYSYKLELNTSNITIQEGQTYQLQATPYINNEIDSAAVIEYISLDTSICTIDSKGLVTSLKAGTTVIKVKYQDVEEIVSINILPKPQISYVLKGSDTLDTKTIQTYTIVDQNNLPIIDKEFSWKFEQVGNTTVANLIIPKGSTANSYNLLGKSQYTKGSVILVATCKTDTNIVIKKEIKVV